MKAFLILAALAGGLAVANRASAAVIVWTATNHVSPDTNWSTAANWTGGAPGSGNDTKFYDRGAIGNAVSNLNNVVDSSVTVASLHYGNTNGSHTTFVAPGAMLTVAGDFTAGTTTDNG